MRLAATFEVSGIEPNDLLWTLSGEDVHRAFWRMVVVQVLKFKDEELAAGLDRYGRPLKAISWKTKKYRKSEMGAADPNAPPLMPAYGVSRTRLNLDGRAYVDHAEFFWRDGWGKILAIHRSGSRRRHLPNRDVIGLSPKAMRKVEAAANTWWSQFKATQTPPSPTVDVARERVRLPVLGRTDFENFTYGIGASRGDQAAKDRRLLAQGRTTGFYSTPPPGGFAPESPVGPGNPFFGGPKPQAPTIDALGVKFVRTERAKTARAPTVVVSVEALNAAWKKDGEYYVPKGGGADKQKYRSAINAVEKAAEDESAVYQPRVSVGLDGVVAFLDGRHRFAALRDLGARFVAVSVDKPDAARAKALFGRL